MKEKSLKANVFVLCKGGKIVFSSQDEEETLSKVDGQYIIFIVNGWDNLYIYGWRFVSLFDNRVVAHKFDILDFKTFEETYFNLVLTEAENFKS